MSQVTESKLYETYRATGSTVYAMQQWQLETDLTTCICEQKPKISSAF